jgi:integrase
MAFEARRASEEEVVKRVKRPRGLGSVFQRGRVWWIKMPGHGAHSESSGSTHRQDAEDLLDKRLAEMRIGRFMPEAGRATYEDLERMLLDDMRANQRRSIENVEKNILPRLRAFFGGMRARAITYDVVSAYVAQRLRIVSPATVRYERAALRRMFGIAYRAGKVERIPALPTVRVLNTRTNFCSPEEIERVIRHLPKHAKAVVRCLYLMGWRSGEVLSLEWRHVDFGAQTITLEADRSKSGSARTFPFGGLPALGQLLREQREHTSALEHALGRIIPWVFHIKGEPITSFRTGWRNAVRKAGLVGLTPHDLRRSAARNLVRAGVPEKVVMDLCGWKTRAMFDRYNITSARDLAEGVERLGTYLHGAPRSAKRRLRSRGT